MLMLPLSTRELENGFISEGASERYRGGVGGRENFFFLMVLAFAQRDAVSYRPASK